MSTNPYPRPANTPQNQEKLLTIRDLENFKTELLLALIRILDQRQVQQPKKWLKSHEVQKMLRISSGTLFSMRMNKVIPYTKIGNIIYYDQEEINALLMKQKKI